VLGNISKKTVVIGIVVIYVIINIVLITVYLLNNQNNSSEPIVDSYGDTVETKLAGEPINSDEKIFTVMQNNIYYSTYTVYETEKIDNIIKNFIWDNINKNEKKAVMLEEFESKEINSNIVNSFDIKTNNNTESIKITITQNKFNQVIGVKLDYKDISKSYDIT